MKPRSGLIAARGQIAWILALLVSTGIVIQLERLDLGARADLLSENPLAGSPDQKADLLQDAHARMERSDPDDAEEHVRVLLALSLAALQPGSDMDMLSAEAEVAIERFGARQSSSPLVSKAVALARSVFGI